MMSKETSNEAKFNEQVVEELVSDFRDSQFVVEPSSENENAKNNIEEEFDASESETNDAEKEQKHSSDVDKCEEDEFNEAELEKQELELTEEEKKKRRTETTELKNQGNNQFKNEQFTDSAETYTKGLRLCPLKYSEDRAILYANRAASKIKLGDNSGAIDDCTKAVKLNDKYVRAYLRRAKLYEDTDKLDESLEDYKKIAELDPGNREAIIAQQRLPPKINERNEKLKEEMLGKLKDLGNLVLRPFGLSTDNFKLQQDPNSGGYSVNFQNNPTN